MIKRISVFALCMVICFALCSCGVSDSVKNDLWETATYKENTEFGEGADTIEVEVKAQDRSVTFTIHTDKEYVGDALMEHHLIAGEKSVYGMYVKTVNGIVADYDKDQTYWEFCKDGEVLPTGVDGAKLSDGEHFELVHKK